MKTFKFIERLLGHNIIISNHSERGWDWFSYYEYAKLTSLIDFECNFDGNGVCKQRRPHVRKNSKNVSVDNSCCCGDCSFSIGFLKAVPNCMAIIKEIAGLFSGRTGFWRKDIGCILPRQYRSVVCLTHECRKLDNCVIPSEALLRMLKTPWEPKLAYNRAVWETPKSFIVYAVNRPIKVRWINSWDLKEMLLKERNGVENIRLPIIKNNLTGHSKCRPQ